MMQILGLLDTLEAMILASKKVPLTDKVILEEGRILEIVDKMRVIIRSGGGAAKRAIEKVSMNDHQNERVIISKAQREARLIREGANKYADDTLANLLTTVLKLERTLNNGRQRLAKVREHE
ncbi:MAG: hypothetical protein ABIH39_02290 [Candidatus Margulisiibacteriota bacterium]